MSEKGQILIPKKLRERIGLKPGSPVQLIEEAEQLVLKPVSADPIAAATGFLKIEGSLQRDLIEEHKEETCHKTRNSAAPRMSSKSAG